MVAFKHSRSLMFVAAYPQQPAPAFLISCTFAWQHCGH